MAKDKNKKQKEGNALVSVMAPEELLQYIRAVSNPWKTFWFNFFRGTAYGLGIVLGTAIVLTIVLSVMNLFIDYPIIGAWLKSIGESISTGK